MLPTSFDVVCPVCETLTTAGETQQGQELPCPQCGYTFVWQAHEGWQQSEESSPWPGLLDRLPLPDMVEEELLRRRNSLPPTVPPRKATQSVGNGPALADLPPATVETTTDADSEPETSEANSTQPKVPELTHPAHNLFPQPRTWLGVSPLWWLSGACIIACVAIIALAWQMGSANSPGDPNAPGNEGNRGDNEAAEQTAGTDSNREFKSTLLSDAELDKAWQQLGPYMVAVEIESSDSTSRTTGFLIDTRGWVLVRASALVGANRGAIEVAPRDWRLDTAESPRRGVCHGLLGLHSDLDLAVVAVDPTVFHVFTDIEFVSTNEPPTQVLIAGTTSEAAGWWQEVSCGPMAQNRLTVSEAISEERMAGPAVDSRGELIGVVALDPSASGPRVIGYPEISAWLDTLDGKFTPWSEAEIEMPVAADKAATEPLPVKRDNPGIVSLEALETIESIASLLAENHWEIRTRVDYEAAQKIAELVTVVESNTDNPGIEQGLKLLLEQGVDDLRSQLQTTAWPAADVIQQTNELADNLTGPGEGIWAYGEVAMTPALSPEYNDRGTIVLKLLRTDKWLILPANENFDQFKVGTRWLVWGTTGDLRQLTFEDADGNLQTGLIVEATALMAEPELITPAE